MGVLKGMCDVELKYVGYKTEVRRKVRVENGDPESSISITNTLTFKTKLNGTLNTFTEPTTNTGADASLFTWTGYDFSAGFS